MLPDIFICRACANMLVFKINGKLTFWQNWAAGRGGGADRFDRYSKLCTAHACYMYVTLSCQQASATVPKTAILNESSTLIFSAVTKSILDNFLEESSKLIRIKTLKNEQNWSSGFWELCIVLFLRSDRYSVPPGDCVADELIRAGSLEIQTSVLQSGCP